MNNTFNQGNGFVPAKCTFCGGETPVNPSDECTVCPFCGKPFITANAIQNYAQSRGVRTLPTQPSQQQPKKKRTWLWVLGWIFIFPVPLTILMVRNQKLSKIAKTAIIAVGWAVYLILMITSRYGNRNATNPEPAVTEPASVITTTETPVRESTTAVQTTEATVIATTSATSATTITSEVTTTMSTAKQTSADDVKSAVQNGDFSLVTPKFKQMMDSYEKFYDDYIAFMKKYKSDPGNVMSMLNDYMNMLDQLQQWSDKIDAVDESKLSPADDAYFLLVTLRIEQKLLKAMI